MSSMCMMVGVVVCVGGVPIQAQVLLGASGWKPTPLKDWVRTTVAWYKDAANAAYTMAFVRQNSMFG